MKVHCYLEEDGPTQRRVGVHEVEVAEEDPVCSEIRPVKNQKVIEDLVHGQRVLAEELRKQQQSLVSHVEEQKKVLGQQQQTLNKLLAAMESKLCRSDCYNCGQEGHIARFCTKTPKGTRGPRQDQNKPGRPASNYHPSPQ